MTRDPHDLTDELADAIGSEHVHGSPRALRDIGVDVADGDAPAWWLRPGAAAEVAQVIRIAARAGVAVIPIGNVARAPRASSLRGRPCFFVDTRRMRHVLHLDETSLVTHIQAGLTGHALERLLAPRGLSIGDYPPATMNATIGGLLAVRTPGKSSARHGFLENAVLGVSVVLPDGRMIHTRVAPRRATGPDLARAVCGAEGTLGIITSAVLRIHRRPEARLLDAHVLPSFETAVSAVRLALREDATPAALRVLDGPEARASLGDDICRGNEAVLCVATAGPTDLATCDRDLIASAANAMGGRPLGPAPAEIWWRRRAGHGGDGAPAAIPTLQVAAAPAAMAPAYRAVRAVAAARDVSMRAHASRFEADGAVIFFSFRTGDDAAPLDDAATADMHATAADAARAAGAVLLGHTPRGVTPYLADLRALLDPRGIMNPAALRPA